jgi:DNA-binding NtrC family response regulator
VLFVEDNTEVAEVGRAILVERGHQVTHCGNAKDALDLLEAGPFEVMCSDLVMPGRMNGLALARTVRERWPQMHIVLMTGYSEAAGTATKEGFTLLRKPYEPLALTQAVEAASNLTEHSNVVHLAKASL